MSSLHFISAARTDTGIVRDHNEDALLEHPEAGLWAVADGMGGHSAGDLASRMVIDALARIAPGGRLSQLADRIEDGLIAVNAALRQMALERSASTIGSTVAVVVARDAHALCMWAGDSRIYRARDGRFEQVTQDHALVSELLARGAITHEQAHDHPHGNLVTRAVGAAETLHVDIEILDIEPGDRLLLSTDGLDKEVERDEIGAIATAAELERIPSTLVDLALERGARDNVSVVAVQAVSGAGVSRSLSAGTTGSDAGEDTLPDFSLDTGTP